VTLAENSGRKSLVEAISRDLREQILAGKLAPGQRISQLSIAEHYGVSRLPVREALRSLSSEGLVVIAPSRGARVTALDAGDLREVYLMREQLEPLAVGLAVERVIEKDIHAAEDLLKEMETLRENENEWLRLDREFHTMWYQHSQMPRLARTIDQLWDVSARYRAMFTKTPGARSTSDLEHWLLLESIRRRSPADAEALTGVHLRHVRLTLETTVAPEASGRLR
jgi:DNA-binding GntR family transcriptional regulator